MSQPTPTLPPDQAIATLVLAPQAELGLVPGINLFTGPIRPMTDTGADGPAVDTVPSQAVFVLLAGGEATEGSHDQIYKTASVHVWVRGEPHVFDPGQALARAVWRAIHRKLVDNYVGVECQECEPRYSGDGDINHHVWMIAVRMQYWE